MKTIKGVLKYKDWGDCNLCVEYEDEKYEVYSYECGDGIWGWNIEEEEEFKEAEKLFGKEAVMKALDEYEEVPVEVPFSHIEKQGYSIITKKGHKLVQMAEKDGWHMISDGVCQMPDGSLLEPDAEGSPLMEMGLI